MSKRASWQFWIGMLVSLGCGWLALRAVPLGELTDSLTEANYTWLVPAVVLQVLAIVTRAQRWVVLLGERARLSDSFWAQSIGYLFTNVLPLRMGEPVRTVIMSDRAQLPLVATAATVILERLLDVAAVVLMLILVLPWMRVPALVAQAGTSFGVLVLLMFAALLVSVRFSGHSERLLRCGLRRVPFMPADVIVSRWRELLVGLSKITEPRAVVAAIGWSLLTWLCSIGVYWCALRAFQPAAALVEAAFMVVAISLAVTVPSSPGFIGVFQLAGEQALVIPFGDTYTPGVALSVTIVVYLVYYLLGSLLGVVGLWRLGESLTRLRGVLSAGRQLHGTRVSEGSS